MANDQTKTDIVASQTLGLIITANPALTLDQNSVNMIASGHLVFVPNPVDPPAPQTVGVPKGCLELLRYGDDDEDLDLIKINGVAYRAENLKGFKETFERAACCHFCVNFCIVLKDPSDPRKFVNRSNRILMVNLYPCSECKPIHQCGCQHTVD